MKKLLLMVAAAAVIAISLSACGSLRTPATGKNKNLTYYYTFFGLSIESAIYGDGFIVNPMSNN